MYKFQEMPVLKCSSLPMVVAIYTYQNVHTFYNLVPSRSCSEEAPAIWDSFQTNSNGLESRKEVIEKIMRDELGQVIGHLRLK